MVPFLIYTIVMILLGLFVRTFWLELLVIWYIFLWILNLIIGSWLITVVVKMYHFLINGNVWEDFNTTWAYCAVFYTVLNVVYLFIIADIATIILKILTNLFKKQ